MADIFNDQRVVGICYVPDGTTMYNGRPVVGVYAVADGLFLVDNQRVVGGVEITDGSTFYNDQPVLGAVLIQDGRKLYNNQLVTPLGTASRWRLPGLMVSAGDSETGRATGQAQGNFGPDYANLVPWFTNGKCILVYNGGNSGETTAQILARVPSLLAKLPNGGFLLFMGGTNDAASGIALSTTQANFASVTSLCLAANVVPVFVTIPPKGNDPLASPTGVLATPSTSGGTLAAGTYGYRVSAVNGTGETLASTEVTAVTTGATGSVLVSWTPVPASSSYKVYGRTAGSELLLATVSNSSAGVYFGNVTYTDTGAATPSGALPASNTTQNSSTGAIIAAVNAINSWLVPWCSSNGYLCADLRTITADQATGFYPVGGSWDGTHPIGWLEHLMASSVVQQIGRYITPAHSYLATSEGDAGNMQTNSQFSANNGTLPTGWSASGAGSATTTVAPVSGILGNALAVTVTNAASSRNVLGNNITTGWSVGDVLYAGFKLKITGNEAAGANPSVGFRCLGNGAYWACGFMAPAVDTDGVVEVNAEFTIPAGQGITGFQFQILSGSNGSGETITVGQLTLRNLTTGALIIP